MMGNAFTSALIGLLFFVAVGIGRGKLPEGWSATNIGDCSGGPDDYAGGVYTIKGTGGGLSPQADQAHFLSQTLSGNFRLTIHLVSFDGAAGSQVGLMARQGTDPAGTMAAIIYAPGKGSGAGPNVFECFARDKEPGALYPWRNNGMNSALSAPCWMQLVRYGNNFAVSKSADGKFWHQVHSFSGGAFSVKGPVQVGIFVASGGEAMATARIDNVNLEKSPALPYESSWIGNSFSSDYAGFVSGNTLGMWVAPDGTCYCTSYWDEGGEPGKRYKDGKVLGPFGLGAAGAYEGSITGDAKHVYYLATTNGQTRSIFQTDRTTSNNSDAFPLYLQTPLIDPKSNNPRLAGLASANGELYVSDQLTSQILVVDPSLPHFNLANYVAQKFTDHVIDTSGVSNPAPLSVYQSCFQADLVAMTIPGLSADHAYNVRLHFAETNPDDGAVGKRLMNLYAGDQTKNGYDIFGDAGALYKAAVFSFTGIKPKPDGTLAVAVQRGNGSPDGWATISGIEITNPDGSPVMLFNCGAAAVGEWKSTIQELPERAFPFTRPGPIAADKNGNLWIVQEGATFPAATNFSYTPGWAAIKLYDKNGHYLNKQITDVVNPTAICYNNSGDKLLVAENGPDQNIRIYDANTDTSAAPVCSGTFGIKGGIFAGNTPGLIHDSDAGDDARFFGPTGIGTDSEGNLYVACDSGCIQTDLRAFNPAGKLLWSLKGLEMTNTGDFDPTRGDSDIWTTTHHYTMNYRDSTAGGEWKLKSFITNPFAPYHFPNNLGGGSAVYRKIKNVPLLFTGAQGSVGSIYIYRFSGEQIVPCGWVMQTSKSDISVWIDKNGDGIPQPDEIAPAVQSPDTKVSEDGGVDCFDVDDDGNLYVARFSGYAQSSIEKYPFQGFDPKGVPIYSRTYTAASLPPPFDKEWSKARIRYQGGTHDTMFILGATSPHAGDGNFGGTLACYDHWSTKPEKRFITVLPTPADEPAFMGGPPPFQADGFVYETFDMANGFSFVSDIWGTIHVVDPQGKLLTNIIPGPEIDGLCAWEDEAMGLRVHYNPERGEYDILQENSGFRGRQNFYRWKP